VAADIIVQAIHACFFSLFPSGADLLQLLVCFWMGFLTGLRLFISSDRQVYRGELLFFKNIYSRWSFTRKSPGWAGLGCMLSSPTAL